MADPTTSPTDLLDTLSNLTGPGALAFILISLWRQWAVFGWLYRSEKKRADDLQAKNDALNAAVIDKVIPALTEANLLARQLEQLIQHDVSVRDPRRSP